MMVLQNPSMPEAACTRMTHKEAGLAAAFATARHGKQARMQVLSQMHQKDLQKQQMHTYLQELMAPDRLGPYPWQECKPMRTTTGTCHVQ